MAISKFKATCRAVLERLRRTRKPIMITRFGKPVAEIGPPPPPEWPETWLGALRGTARIEGNIISPAVSEEDWDVHGS